MEDDASSRRLRNVCFSPISTHGVGAIRGQGLTPLNRFESVMYPGNVLDLSYGSSEDKTPITSYPKHGQLNQQWRLDAYYPPDSESLGLTINVDL